MIFDTHCHLNDEALYGRVDEVIEAAKKVGVGKFLVVGWDKESSLLAIDLANKYPEVYAAIGFHPCNIEGVSEEDYEEVMSHLEDDKVVCLGEIGLDYHWVKDLKQREEQKKWFIKQINTANLHQKPISIHNREAFEDCLNILKEHRPEYSGVMHCYSGSVELLKDVMDLGLYIGLDGPVTFTNAKTPKEVCEDVPLDRLLTETDSPYLAPHPLRGTVNEPKNIALIVDEITRLKGLSKKHIIDATYNNACRLFNIHEENN
ncbi:MAG: TatD family hydrolase [Bacilli bacterium]|nr:TatD family hydrolase [Bacilli bacterium]